MENKWLVSTTYGENYDPLAELVTPNHLGYCRKNGYDYNVHHAPFNSKTVYYNANIDLVFEMLPYYGAIALIDLDVVFMDWNVSLDSLFPKEYSQQIAREELAEGGALYNAGVVLLRSSNSTWNLLKQIREYRSIYEKHCQVWQKQIQDYIQAGAVEIQKMNVVSAQTMNAHPWPGRPPSYQKGNPIVHAYCMYQDDKIKELSRFLPEVIK